MDEPELLREAVFRAAAFAELYHVHVTGVYRYHMAHLGIAKAAEELTSQTFLAALAELHSLRGSSSFVAWIMGIAAEIRLNDVRGSRRELPSDAVLYYQSTVLPTDRAAMQRMEMEATSRALKQIPLDHAEAVILAVFGGLSNSDISQVLKKSAAAAGMLVIRGIRDLRTRSSLTADEQDRKDQGSTAANFQDEVLAEKLADLAGQIQPDPQFIADLEEALLANHRPKAKRTLSLQPITSAAGWALLIGLGVFLLNWRVAPTSPSITAKPRSTAATEAVLSKVTSGPSPTRRATATSLPLLEYVVQAGDTCTYIAERFGVTINDIMNLNDLNDACDIWIDQKLVIPILVTSTPENQ